MLAVAGWTVLLGSGALLVYGFVVYPMVTLLLAWRRRRPVERRDVTPPVTLFIAARNEASHIAERVRNAQELEYPDLRVVVVSDGSQDGTTDIVGGLLDERTELVDLPRPVGKTAAAAAAVAQCGRHGVYAFTDATARWSAATLATLVRSFADPSVGAVSGLVVYDYAGSGIASGFRAYQAAVVPGRMAESAFGSVTSLSGSICAIRAELWAETRPELSYDLVHPLHVAIAGLRSVLDSEAVSYESARERPEREYRSRVRLALSAFAFLGHLRRTARRVPGAFLWQVLSHKAVRWLAPLLVVLVFVSAAALAPGWPRLMLPVVSAIVAAVALGLLGLVPGLSRAFGAPLFALTVGWAYLVGLVRFARGERVRGWEPEEQR